MDDLKLWDEIHDLTVEDLCEELVGKTVVAIDERRKTLTLSDGTVFEFKDAYDCCAWFCCELEAGNLTDNAVTDVQVTDPDPITGDERLCLHILATDTNIADLDIEGDATSGYYCRSISLRVWKPVKDGS